MKNCTRPATVSPSASGIPLNGTCTTSIAAGRGTDQYPERSIRIVARFVTLGPSKARKEQRRGNEHTLARPFSPAGGRGHRRHVPLRLEAPQGCDAQGGAAAAGRRRLEVGYFAGEATGLPFSTTYVASTFVGPVPTFFPSCTTPA